MASSSRLPAEEREIPETPALSDSSPDVSPEGQRRHLNQAGDSSTHGESSRSPTPDAHYWDWYPRRISHMIGTRRVPPFIPPCRITRRRATPAPRSLPILPCTMEQAFAALVLSHDIDHNKLICATADIYVTIQNMENQ
jgi:hypothetical protein